MGFLRLFLLISLLIPATSQAVIVSRVTEFEPHTKALASDLNDEFDNIISAINGNLGPENFTTGGVGSENIADLAVTTEKLADEAVTGPKLADLTIPTEKIATGAITKIKQADPGVQFSDDSGSYFLTGSTDLSDVPEVTASITTIGRPVFVGLQGKDGEYGGITSYNSSGLAGNESELNIGRDSATANTTAIEINAGTSNSAKTAVPCSSFWFIDSPSAGTHQYKLRAKISDSGTELTIQGCKLVLFEL